MDPPAVEDSGEGANVADGGLLERRALDRGGLPLAVPPSVRLVAVPACQPVFIGREWTHLATERCSLPLLALAYGGLLLGLTCREHTARRVQEIALTPP